jgi:hypothetical protein
VELLEGAGCLGPDGPVTLVNKTAAANGKMLTFDQQCGRASVDATAAATVGSSSSRQVVGQEEDGWTATYW